MRDAATYRVARRNKWKWERKYDNLYGLSRAPWVPTGYGAPPPTVTYRGVAVHPPVRVHRSEKRATLRRLRRRRGSEI